MKKHTHNRAFPANLEYQFKKIAKASTKVHGYIKEIKNKQLQSKLQSALIEWEKNEVKQPLSSHKHMKHFASYLPKNLQNEEYESYI